MLMREVLLFLMFADIRNRRVIAERPTAACYKPETTSDRASCTKVRVLMQ